MTAMIWVAIIFLIVELIFIYIVVHKSYRFKHTIDPVDERVKDLNRDRTDIE